ncbi:MAG: ABC transporter ATP-binding protein [Candidatus Eisenbacteria bacterium]
MSSTAPNPPDRRPGSDRSAVRVEGLGKDFRHPWTRRIKTAVHEVSFDVPEGGVFGLLGPNGAGKTTTLRVLLGLLPATRGRAFLLGRPAGPPESRQDVGFLPENPYFYDHLTALEFLEFSGELAGMSRAAARAQAHELIERVGLAHAARTRMRKYSKGMLQRAGLAHALMGRPRLLFLDEPMSGLDPIGRREVVDLIRELKAQGTTVVFSSHILHDVEVLCDRVAILRAGRLLKLGTLDALLEGGGAGAEIVVRSRGVFALPPEFLGVEIENVAGRVRLVLDDAARASALVAWLAGRGHEVISLTPERRSLEDLFMDMFQGAHDVGGDPERAADAPSTDWRAEA